MEVIGLIGVKVHDRVMTNTFVGKSHNLHCKKTSNWSTIIAETVKDIIKFREESSEKRNDFMELMLQMKNHGISLEQEKSDGENGISE